VHNVQRGCLDGAAADGDVVVQAALIVVQPAVPIPSLRKNSVQKVGVRRKGNCRDGPAIYDLLRELRGQWT
jgi:hypothetical protein